MVMDKVLSGERSTAYATTINDINNWWLHCEECNWYKSERTILSAVKLLISNNYCMFLNLFLGSLRWLEEYQEVSLQ